MASFEEAVATYLTTPDALTARIGTRAYDSQLPAFDDPAAALPAIVFTIVSRPDEPHFTGYCPETAFEVQIDTYGPTAASRRDVAEIVRQRMAVWSGMWGGIVIRRALKVSDFDNLDGVDDGGPLPTFRNTQRWTVWNRRAPVPV